METGFLNFHDEEHFSTMPSSLLYDQGNMLEDSESSLLDMIPEDFTRYRDPWDQDGEQELNGDIATLPGGLIDSAAIRIHSKEDFHKMLNDWQDHIGSMQATDNEEIYDEIEPMPDCLPGMDIFDESSFDGDNISSSKKLDKTQMKKSNKLTGKKVVGKDLSLGHFLMEDDDETDRLLIMQNDSATEHNSSMEEADNLDDAFRIDVDDDCIDVETVTGNEQIPVLEAVDVTSLLEQFEASESVNCLSHNATALDSQLFAMATEGIGNNVALSALKPTIAMSHQNIIDALPKEVIERIKASGRKKAIPVIPAMPSKKMGRAGTRMQDAGAALSRNKLLKIVSSGTITGESIQLDHDYCSASSSSCHTPEVVPPRSFYHSDASEYSREEKTKPPVVEKAYSRLPDYYLVLGPQQAASKKDNDSRKDSGLESGDSSDASDETSDKTSCDTDSNKTSATTSDKTLTKSTATTVTTMRDKIVTINGKDINLGSIMQNVNKALVDDKLKDKRNREVPPPMVSVLKRNSSVEENVAEVVKKEVVDEKYSDVKEVEPKKRKLNLSEYRNRVKELDRTGVSCESSRANSPVAPETPTLEEAKQIFEQATQMLINAKGQIDEESFAAMRKTLEKQAAIKMPSHDAPLVEYKPRLIQIKMEKPCSKVPEHRAAVKIPAMEEVPSKKVQSTVTEDIRVIKSVPDKVPVKMVASPVVKEIKVENVPSLRETVVKVEAVKIVPPSPVAEVSESLGMDETESVLVTADAAVIDSGGLDSSPRLDDMDILPAEVEVMQSDDEVSVETKSNDNAEVSGARRDRSRRQYRSHRATSSSSSSPSPHRQRQTRERARQRRQPRRSRSNCSSESSRSRSGSRGGARGWRRERKGTRRSRRRSRSPRKRGPEYQVTEKEKERQVEERRVIYVGRISEGMTKAELRARFEAFGPIVDISVHFREHGDNYGFVTFAYKVDAYEAVEQGKKDPILGQYDLSFGGRRAFCKMRYSDLDGSRQDDDGYGYLSQRVAPIRQRPTSDVNFDDLLREALKKKKKEGKV